MTPQLIEAELTWTGDRFERGVQVAVDTGGRIEAVGRLGRTPTLALARKALLPGFVNAHSHAFQWALRGRGERFPAGSGSFWTWRDAMYRLAASLEPGTALQIYTQAFREMRDAGITTVGEFHYLHHSGSGADYDFDLIVLEAAARAGIRLVLLQAYYVTGGVGRPLQDGQQRFASVDLEGYWSQLDRLAAQLEPGRQSLGVVAHSVRAAPPGDIAALHGEASRRGLRFHMHVEEQPGEIEECLAAYGRRPMALLLDEVGVGDNLTAVHCTHTAADDMARFLADGGTVCICPLTEANLGDGLPPLEQAHRAGLRVSLGTDSNARIGFLEEMRWLEYGQRLRGGRRGVLADGEGRVGRVLLDAATAAGAGALGVEAGRLAAGSWADFAVVDLEAPTLAPVDPDHLLEGLIFGGGNEAVWATAVAGAWRRRGGAPEGA